MWNDTDLPPAYLITFRCHRSWLHGDERGSTDRFHHVYNTPHIPANLNWSEYNAAQLKGGAVTLNASQRKIIENAIREVCVHGRWDLYALNVRTNHVHVVVGIGALKPERALNAFKAFATRHMRRTGTWQRATSPWSDKGSSRYLWNDCSVGRAIEYVRFGQGDEPPEFD